MEYETDISEPHVSSFAEAHSIDQLAVAAGTEGNQYTIEAGWDVDQDKWESSPKPHFFIFVNPDKYGSESCYDCHFVSATEAKITPGAALEPSTSRFKIGVKYTGGDWWIWAGTQWIGYVPASAWGGHFTKGTREVNYGEVFDNEEHPTSAMGDGQFGSSASATFMTQSLVTFPAGEEETTGYHGEATNSSLYSIGDINSGKTEWHFGGPGADPTPSVTTEAASETLETSATLHGLVNPHYLDAHYYFQYGTTTSYGSTTPEGNAGTGGSSVPESATITGLASGTTYHYRIVASNPDGTSYGADQTFFTTPALTYAPGEHGSEQQVFYVGSGGTVYAAYMVSGVWTTEAVSSGYGASGQVTWAIGEKGSEQQVFYVGSGGTVYGAYMISSGEWITEAVSSGYGASGQVTWAIGEKGSEQQVFYVGSGGTVYAAYMVSGVWTTEAVSSGYGALSRQVTWAIGEKGSEQQVFYVGSGGTVYAAYMVSGVWTTEAIASGA